MSLVCPPCFLATSPNPTPNKKSSILAKRTRKMPRGRTAKCVKQTSRKYTERPSPPFPANECCGALGVGNNGDLYQSKADSRGICRWQPVFSRGKTTPKSSTRKSTRTSNTKKRGTRRSARRISCRMRCR